MKRNSIVGNVLGFIAILLIFIIGVGVLIKFPKIEFNMEGLKSIIPEMNLSMGIRANTKNILIIGRGGDLNDAPNLTDTIILAKIDSDNKFVTMLSIPRDLWVKYPTGGAGKINETYMRALKKNDYDIDTSIKVLEEKIEEITGEKVDNYVNIDFKGFISIVDSVGGVDINVPETLVDTEYPDFNWGYQTLKVEAGLQHMDGSLALKYARSRHSTNDFDRSLRQQLVIRAIKEKVTSLGYLANPFKIKALYLALKSNITTDLGISDMISLALLAKQVEKNNIFSFNLNDSCFYGSASCKRGGFLYTPPRENFAGASTLLPNTATSYKVDNYTEILRFSNVIFNYPQVFQDNSTINIFNSTKVSGLASIWGSFLTKYGFSIPEKDSIGNTSGTKYDKSIIFYNNLKEDSKTLEALKLFFLQTEFKKVEKPMYSLDPQTKIEIIIGKDYKTYNMY
ncbi:MAG: LCP family protein [Candidatus Gracilibacteria bacterium]|nr:LCP family protein [Candidatus Gracilibacteria bacterium]